MEPRTRITIYMPPALLTRLGVEAERRSKLAGVKLTVQLVGRALIEEGLTGRDASFLDLRSVVGGYAGTEQRMNGGRARICANCGNNCGTSTEPCGGCGAPGIDPELREEILNHPYTLQDTTDVTEGGGL